MKRWPLVLGIVAAVLVLCCAGGVIGTLLAVGNDDDGTGAAPATSQMAGLNAPVRDGKFEFAVSTVECGRARVGTAPFDKAAQGQFCLVHLSVRNIGDQPQTLFDGAQKAFGPTGIEYGADTGAGVLANGNGNVWANKINPGNAIDGILVYDIPKGAAIARLQLHDSGLSGGVNVRVSS